MKPVSFPEANALFHGEGCLDVPAYVGTYEDDTPIIIACWRFSEEDLATINEDRCIYLGFLSEHMVPHLVYDGNPFEEGKPDTNLEERKSIAFDDIARILDQLEESYPVTGDLEDQSPLTTKALLDITLIVKNTRHDDSF